MNGSTSPDSPDVGLFPLSSGGNSSPTVSGAISTSDAADAAAPGSSAPSRVGLRELARLLDVGPSHVHRLKAKGILAFDDVGLIDVEVARAAIAASTDPAKGYMAEVNKRQRARHRRAAGGGEQVDREGGGEAGVVSASSAPPAAPETPAVEEARSEAAVASDNATYWAARTRRELAAARQAELELERTLGSLVDRKAVEQTFERAGRQVRDALLGLPARLAPELVTMTDEWELEQRLTQALRDALADQVRAMGQDLQAAVT